MAKKKIKPFTSTGSGSLWAFIKGFGPAAIILVLLFVLFGCGTSQKLGHHQELNERSAISQFTTCDKISEVKVKGYSVASDPQYFTIARKSQEANAAVDYQVLGTSLGENGKPGIIISVLGGMVHLELLGTLKSSKETICIFRNYLEINGKPSCFVAYGHLAENGMVEICTLTALVGR